MHDERYINHPQDLEAFCRTLRTSEWITLDTEFAREKTYYPRLCLLQVANDRSAACVDPLVLPTLDPLLDVLYDTSIIKVLHAAYQDLEIFYLLRGELPRPVFDTQIAASLLGYGEQTGYAALVNQVLEVPLDKTQTRTDWCRRPLTEAQLRYALDDVIHLCAIYRRLTAELRAKDRLPWVIEDCARLCDPDAFRIDTGTAWRRIRGLHNLNRRQLGVLRALAAWRERRAIAADRPRKWIMPDHVLIALAKQMPADRQALGTAAGLLMARRIKRHEAELLDAIAAARAEPPDRWPRRPYRVLDPARQRLVADMAAQVAAKAGECGISPSAIAPRAALERLALGDTDLTVLTGWRAGLIAGALRETLAQELG